MLIFIIRASAGVVILKFFFFRLSFIYLYANVVIRAPCFFTLFKRL